MADSPLPAMSASRIPLYLNLIRFDRPAGWLVLVWPTLTALWVAAGGFPGWHLLVVFVLGTVLMRSAGCCINDVADREFDRHVKRTAGRPVTTGAISVQQALFFGGTLAALAFLLVLTTNRWAVAWSVPALLVTIAYPFAKRFVSMPQAVLGIAFNFGIVIAFAAVRGNVPPVAWVMWVANLFWVLAYDTEYAMVDRDDDLKIGMKTSAITLGRFDVAAVVLFYAFSLSIWAAALYPYALGAPLVIALAVSAAQAIWHWTLICNRSRDGCFIAFSKNHWLGATLFAGVLLGFALK
jgi:4-hydroxybenzoate polyprenyltransferase